MRNDIPPIFMTTGAEVPERIKRSGTFFMRNPERLRGGIGQNLSDPVGNLTEDGTCGSTA